MPPTRSPPLVRHGGEAASSDVSRARWRRDILDTGVRVDRLCDVVGVTREELAALLATAQGEAVATCAAVVADANAVIHHGLPENLSAIQDQLTTWRRRAEHVRRIGLPVVGMDEAVRALTATDHERVRVVGLTPVGRYPSCVLFISPGGDEVVAALAVTGPVPGDGPAGHVLA
jgi:hypothetical protein